MNLLRIFVMCHIVFRTCNRTELAGENNDCFAIMSLQFKIVGARSWLAPSPSPFASGTNSVELDATLNSTEEMSFPQTQQHIKTLQWIALLQPHCIVPKFTLASVTDTPMNSNNHMKRLDNCLWFYVVWPEQLEFSLVGQDIFRGKNQENSRPWGENPVSSPATV